MDDATRMFNKKKKTNVCPKWIRINLLLLDFRDEKL